MRSSRQIIQSFSLFYRNNPVKLVGVFLLTLLLGFNQGISIVMLIPLLSLLDQTQPSAAHNKIVDWLQGVTDRMGFQLSLESILVCFVVLLTLIALLGYYKSQWQSEYEQRFIHTLRGRLFRKIVMSDWELLTSKSRHKHLQVLSNEIPKVSTYYFALMNLITSVILIAANVALSLLVSVKFTGLILLVGLVSFLLLKKFILQSLAFGGSNIGIFRQMTKQIDDFWTMIKQAKVHNAEQFYYEKYNGMNTRMLHLQRKQNKNRALSQLIFTTAGIVGLVFVIYVGYRIDTLPLTSIFVLILLFGRLFPLFTSCNTYLDMIVSNLQSANLVISMDKTLSDTIFDAGTLVTDNHFCGDIMLQDISFAYSNGNLVFKAINLQIPAHSVTGIIGQSGKGKTTLLDLITGLLHPQTGFLSIGGSVLSREQGALWRQQIGYLTQETHFVDGTMRENLTWDTPYEVSDEEIMKVLAKVNAVEIVTRERESLDAIITNFPYHFSGGERQRLALARVLLRFPKVLLLDEATSALDPHTESLILQCLSALKSEITIIFVTHRESLIPWFDQVIDLNRLLSSAKK
ncbi:MAG: transporter ATP-binding protein [Bacteroidetes bacterium]|nr:transporter ATP-binding protein [Bacteroidota bacterium]